MQTLGTLFLLVMGAGLLAVTCRGYRLGEWPAGWNPIGACLPGRKGNLFAFRFLLALYFCGGMAPAVWGLLALVGLAPPLRLR